MRSWHDLREFLFGAPWRVVITVTVVTLVLVTGLALKWAEAIGEAASKVATTLIADLLPAVLLVAILYWVFFGKHRKGS